jgi:hypothetical protein
VFVKGLRGISDILLYWPKYLDHVDGTGTALSIPASALTLEFIVAKRTSHPYTPVPDLRTATIEEHTHHKADSTGSQCVACYMSAIET